MKEPAQPSNHTQGELALNDERALLDSTPEPKVKRPSYPIWTENKAKLIERYLYYFVLITKHGAYIDGFAGPQKPDKPEMWAARLVLESEPRWLRHFFLFDRHQGQARRLRELKEAQPAYDAKGNRINREIRVEEGDFNTLGLKLLKAGDIGQNEAAFCLLDQRTFQCHWATLGALANYKHEANNKIELFYFLAVGWMARALSGVKNDVILQKWWGRGDWREVRAMKPQQISEQFVVRFRSELGYRSAKAWPIYERQNSGEVMYHMIHATDHPDAPGLMARAYERAIQPKESPEQFSLEFPEANAHLSSGTQ